MIGPIGIIEELVSGILFVAKRSIRFVNDQSKIVGSSQFSEVMDYFFGNGHASGSAGGDQCDESGFVRYECFGLFRVRYQVGCWFEVVNFNPFDF